MAVKDTAGELLMGVSQVSQENMSFVFKKVSEP
jgi:hypothetical protein